VILINSQSCKNQVGEGHGLLELQLWSGHVTKANKICLRPIITTKAKQNQQ